MTTPAEKPLTSKSDMIWWPNGFAGIQHGRMFSTTPAWVKKDLAPGNTDQTETLGLKSTLNSIRTLKYFFYSANMVWFVMACGMWFLSPYPIQEAKEKGFAADWMLRRFALNYSVAFVYYSFFHISLYWAKMAKRKYIPGAYPTTGNMLHNLWYWSLAIVQWTWWECVMIRLWATGVVPFSSNTAVLNSPSELLKNVLWVLLIPLWRDLHFYIAHRFIHIRAVYKYVHSLHHRNADPEPFSGMTMHPVEHLYYFSNAFTPSLYLTLSPLIFQWNFIHLTIAPGAGHSGWEDHFQADQYHYVHHAKFECNYGSPFSAFIDQFFGTFREKLGKSAQYTGGSSEKELEKLETEASQKKGGKVWSREGVLGLPSSWDHAVYTVFWVLLFPLVWWGTIGNQSGVSGEKAVTQVAGMPIASVVGAVVAYSPVLLAMLLAFLSKDRMSWRWPFQRERVVGAFGLFVLLGWAACIKPVYDAITWTCYAH